MFEKHLKQFQDFFNIQNLQSDQLFYVDVDRKEIWKTYLSGFPAELVAKNTCNCCKSFMRQYGGIVHIGADNKKTSIWDFTTDQDEYANSVKLLSEYVHSRPITDVFLSPLEITGTPKNVDRKKNIIWQHYNLKIPKKHVVRDADSIPTKLGHFRANKDVLKRSLDELTLDATESVLELIAQNSLYRGKESESVLQEFQKLQKKYSKIPDSEKDAFCWKVSTTSGAVCRMRNTAMGTLLIDLSNNEELDKSVAAYERIMAPTNYKRPVALVTASTLKAAQQRLESLGLTQALNRRLLTPVDISVNNVLFVERTSNTNSDIFSDLQKEVKADPKKLTKTEEIDIKTFIEKVLPTASQVSVLVENRHLNNFVTLVGPKESDTNTLFKWDNSFSWAYTGGVADSIKERVKQAGGNVTGVLRVSLSWYNYDDLDLHVINPKKNRIYFGAKSGSCGGILDVDMNAGYGKTRTPVENVTWQNKPMVGKYTVEVNQFNKRETTNGGYEIEIECDGKVYNHVSKKSPSSTDKVIEFEYTKDGELVIDSKTLNGEIKSQEKWNIKTNTYVPVRMLTVSPNCWSKDIGNKHFLFMLKDCKADEQIKPFLNEYLKPELLNEKRVFETLSSKLKVESVDDELSGIGFSETKPDHVFVRVQGKIDRVLKVKF